MRMMRLTQPIMVIFHVDFDQSDPKDKKKYYQA